MEMGRSKAGPFLLDVGGGEIDGDPAVGEVVAGVLEGRLDPVLALLHRPVGEPDRGELGEPLGDVHLHVHQDGVDADQGAAQDLG